MIQNQYFYVPANSNDKSLCSSSLCLVFLSSYCKLYMCDNLVGRLEIWERSFFCFSSLAENVFL